MDTSSSRQKMSIDRLSALPDCLLVHILSLLDMKDAVITSVLSKRWRSLYTEVPTLAFCETSGQIEKIREFVSRVYRRLLFCSRNSLESFRVTFKYNKSFACDVNVWIEFVVKNKLKEVHLMLNSEDMHTLPQIMYSNLTLKVLSLTGCFMAPERTIKWQSLTELRIWEMELRQHVIENILSGCPVLRYLLLAGCWGFKHLEVNLRSLRSLGVVDFKNRYKELKISAPYVRCLLIGLYPKEQKFHLINITSVVQAGILFTGKRCDSTSEEVMGNAKELLEKTQHAKVLTLSPSFLEVVSMSLMKGWQLPQSRHQSLIISDMVSYKTPHVCGIMGLLESSPNLEKLIIDGSFISKESITWDPPATEDSNFGLLHLEKVKIINFAEPVLALACILLQRAKVLKEMVIVTDLKDTSDFVKISRTLSTYPRSSQNAVIVLR